MTDPATHESLKFSLEYIGTFAGGGLLAFLAQLAFRHWQNSRKRNVKVEQPVAVQHVPVCQTLEECRLVQGRNRADHENLFARVSALEKSGAENTGKLTLILDTVKSIENRLNKRRT